MEKFGVRALELSPMQNVQKIPCPVLILHGTADTICPCEASQQFVEAMLAAGNDCRLSCIEGYGHGFLNYEYRGNTGFVFTLREMDAFLEELGYIQPLVRKFLPLESQSGPASA